MAFESFPTTIPPTDRTDVEIANTRLRQAIDQADFLTYKHLVDENMTCFEPETCGHLVRGTAFHKYYFELGVRDAKKQVTPVESEINIIGDVAIVVATLLHQVDGATKRTMETRVWRRAPDAVSLGKWRLIHFHRSVPTNDYASA